jgi:hypothetical protein
MDAFEWRLDSLERGLEIEHEQLAAVYVAIALFASQRSGHRTQYRIATRGSYAAGRLAM